MSNDQDTTARERAKTDRGRRKAESWAIPPSDPALIDAPFDFLAAEHARQRHVVGLLRHLAHGGVDRDMAGGVRDFLTRDYETHAREERDALYPILKKEARPEDGLDHLIECLTACPDSVGDDNKKIASWLDGVSQGRSLSREQTRTVSRFTGRWRRHIAIEDSALLPIARVRLNAVAVRDLSLRIRAIRRACARNQAIMTDNKLRNGEAP